MTFELVDLEELGEKALHDFTGSFSAGQAPQSSACEAAINRLLAQVELTYGVAAKLAHREPTMEGTVAIWAKMVAICDQAAEQIERLAQEHPAGKPALDRILDYRNAAEKRRELHA